MSAAPLRVLIVDDEPLARRGVRARLPAGAEVVAECGNGQDAVRAIERERPDLVFLDVQMPGLDGFGVVKAVGVDRMPVVVFLTAFDEHALRAFEAQALDYLLKPIDDERFATAVQRAMRRVAERARTDAVLAPIRIAARDRGRVVLLEPSEIDWVEADGDYVRLHTRDRSYLVRETMKAMTARLPAEQFARIHRSTIVNVSRVRELLPHTNRELVVVLDGGRRLKLSRGYRDELEALMRRTR